MSFYKRKINLLYWKSNNFGDNLSPYIVEKLFGCHIQYKKGSISLKRDFAYIIKLIFSFRWRTLNEYIFFWQKNLIAIGSIINLSTPKSIIWGAGFMAENQKFHGGKILAVRGFYTRDKLVSIGYSKCDIVGDPALLLPLLFKPKIFVKKQELAIIPHWTETDYFQNHYSSKFSIIDVRTNNIELIISQITRYQFILSSSLHGIIVAHAYGVPAIWIKNGNIHTDGIKFKDYFSSVSIEVYDGFQNIESILGQNNYIQFFEKHKNIAIPNPDKIKQIQKELLNAAPYKVLNQYKHDSFNNYCSL